VAAVSPVISTIAIVDLRLLGFASTKRPLTELTRAAWTWVAIAVAAVSGALLFISRATNEPLETLGFPMRGAGLKALVVKRRRDRRWAFSGTGLPTA